MRLLYTSDGKLNRQELNQPPHPDEVLVRLARDHMAEWPDASFREAKQMVLRNNMEFARQYHAQFG